ncbi:MAG: methyl-accepting chemotaxis protein [Cyanobacteria bacterium P01_D01_bin.56]
MSGNILGKAGGPKVRQQFLLLFLFSATIPAAVVGLLGSLSTSASLVDNAKRLIQKESQENIEEIDAFIGSADNDVAFLSQMPPIQGIIRARENDGTDPATNSSYDEWVDQLQTVFSAVLQEKDFRRLQYLDEAGKELVVVETEGRRRSQDVENPENGSANPGAENTVSEPIGTDNNEVTVTVLPAEQLQSQTDSNDFVESMRLAAGEVYISPIELYREGEEIKEPYQPVIRYGTPVVNGEGEKRGVVIATVFVDTVIDGLNEDAGQFEGVQPTLVNADGYYLAHPLAEKRWGFELGEDITLESELSAEVAEQILDGGEGTIELEDQLLAYETLNLGGSESSKLITVTEVSLDSVLSSVNSFKTSAALAVLAALGIVIPLAVLRGRQLIGMLEYLAADISSSSETMASTMLEQERIANQQAASVNETTTTMDELEASSRHSAGQATAAVEAAKLALATSEEGEQTVSESLEGMFLLEEKVDAIADKIVNLSDLASQISDVSQLVIDFANQTNMLALNSSVEAVRAGEHGKGFALVANEIRKLADQSQQSADKINNLVSNIQKSINETVMVTEEGTKTVKIGVKISKRTESAFSDIKESVNQVVLNNQQVSLNLKQQVDAIQQVVHAMEVINRGTRETATGLNETRQGTERLNEAAMYLKKVV